VIKAVETKHEVEAPVAVEAKVEEVLKPKKVQRLRRVQGLKLNLLVRISPLLRKISNLKGGFAPFSV